MSAAKPTGQLFSHIYLDRSVPLDDSEIFRRRIGTYCSEMTREGYSYPHAFALALYIKQESGYTVPHRGQYQFDELFVKVPVTTALNLITIVWRYLEPNVTEYRNSVLTSVRAELWLEFVRRALREENLHYTVDDKCGVHYAVDSEFEHNRASALKCLESPRYAGVRAAYESAFKHLESNPSDTKAAVRSMFEALEIVVRLMVTSRNLNRKLIEGELTQLALKEHTSDPTAANATTQLLLGFADWADAIHNYRHGQGSTEPVAPPLDMAVFMLSSGTSFLRWIVSIDTKARALAAAG